MAKDKLSQEEVRNFVGKLVANFPEWEMLPVKAEETGWHFAEIAKKCNPKMKVHFSALWNDPRVEVSGAIYQFSAYQDWETKAISYNCNPIFGVQGGKYNPTVKMHLHVKKFVDFLQEYETAFAIAESKYADNLQEYEKNANLAKEIYALTEAKRKTHYARIEKFNQSVDGNYSFYFGQKYDQVKLNSYGTISIQASELSMENLKKVLDILS